MKNKLVLLSLASLLLIGCQSNKGVIINSESNYDSDPVTDITESGDSNDYDSEYTQEDDVSIPDSFDENEEGIIPSAGNYYLKGDYSKISITASKGSVVYIYLDGINVNSNEGIAFGSEKQVTLYLVLMNNSENTIVNDFEDTNAFHVKGEVHISGEGTLNITSKQKNGLKVSKDLFVSGEGVNLNVTGKNHAITARSITVDGSTISVVSEEKDGIQLECDSDVVEFTKEQGFAYLINAKISADTYGDGIQADTFVYISGGEYNITTHGVFVSYSTSNMSEYGLSTDDFKFVKSGASYKRVATDEIRSLSSSYYALTNSVKGIKAGAIEYDSDNDDVDDVTVSSGEYEIYIAHTAKLTINSTDDAIHTNYGNTTIDSSTLIIDTFDDGVHADYDLKINNASIQINSSYEGLEGANVTIDGEDTNIISNSQDDGINAASDLVSSTNIYINNGYLRVYASGDGLDANTALYLNGGTVIVEGPGSGNGSLDSDQIYFNGGIVFACSTSGMTERMSAKQNTFLYQGNTMNAGVKISIVDSNSNAIFSYTLKQSCNQLIFSHPSLEIGSSYQIVSNTTSLATINMTSSLTKVGSSGGHGGGHGPGGF